MSQAPISTEEQWGAGCHPYTLEDSGTGKGVQLQGPLESQQPSNSFINKQHISHQKAKTLAAEPLTFQRGRGWVNQEHQWEFATDK